MRWAIISLVLLGVLAAVCVAVLVATLPHLMGGGADSAMASQDPDVAVVVATGDLSAQSQVGAESVAVIMVSPSDVPESSYRQALDVIGKVLDVPVIEGQVFEQSQFATTGSRAQMAGIMEANGRLVALTLPDYAGLRGRLYPGAIVDVLAAFDPTRETEPVSTTLLQGIRIMEVDGQTVYSGAGPSLEEGGVVQRASRHMLVVVQVTPEQAQTLLLAQENGTISLAMRNPTDMAAADVEPTRFSQLIGEDAPEVALQTLPHLPSPLAPSQAPASARPAQPTEADPVESATPAETSTEPEESPAWHTTVIRGFVEEVLVFPVERAVEKDTEDPHESDGSDGP